MTEANDIVSSPSVPMPLPGRVIVEFPPAELMKGGIILVKELTEKDVATVIAIGLGTDRAEEMFYDLVKPGMRVLCKEHHGEPFTVGNRTFHIFRMFSFIGLLPAETVH